MKIKITAGGIFDAEGKEIPVGTELTVAEEPTPWAGRYTTLSGSGEGATLVVNPAAEQGGEGGDVQTYEARAKEDAPGWYQVYDAEGVAVGKAMRQADADAFNALSAEDKAEFVKAED